LPNPGKECHADDEQHHKNEPLALTHKRISSDPDLMVWFADQLAS
jgi:hypothetical protein